MDLTFGLMEECTKCSLGSLTSNCLGGVRKWVDFKLEESVLGFPDGQMEKVKAWGYGATDTAYL